MSHAALDRAVAVALAPASLDAPGAFIVTGYGTWGTLNAQATDEPPAELILDGQA